MSGDEYLSRRQRRLKKQVDNDLKAVLSDPAGRRFLMRMIDGTGMFAHFSSPVSEQAIGRRAVGLELVEHIESVSPGAFAELQLESLRLRQELGQPDKGEDEDE